ncbi:Intracisternal A-particle Gag-related polyprotein [Bienertia sinuspersici]
MGGFLEMDKPDSLGLDNFLRIKVMMDIGKPLRRGMKVATNTNTSKWVDIKYERLGDFCYYCGRVGHVDRDYDVVVNEEMENKEVVYRCSPWMRASPLKRRRITREESENERMLLNKIKMKKGGYGEGEKDTVITKLGPPSLARRALIMAEGKEGNGEEEANAIGQKEDEGLMYSGVMYTDGGGRYWRKRGVLRWGAMEGLGGIVRWRGR